MLKFILFNFIELIDCKHIYAKGLCLDSFTISLCAKLLSFQISSGYATPGSRCHTVGVDGYGGLMKPSPCCGQSCQGGQAWEKLDRRSTLRSGKLLSTPSLLAQIWFSIPLAHWLPEKIPSAANVIYLVLHFVINLSSVLTGLPWLFAVPMLILFFGKLCYVDTFQVQLHRLPHLYLYFSSSFKVLIHCVWL